MIVLTANHFLILALLAFIVAAILISYVLRSYKIQINSLRSDVSDLQTKYDKIATLCVDQNAQIESLQSRVKSLESGALHAQMHRFVEDMEAKANGYRERALIAESNFEKLLKRAREKGIEIGPDELQ